MAKIYTAQEMREVADGFFARGAVSRVEDTHWRFGVREYFADQIVSMLRQAADTLEREERREKKYEYGTMWHCDKSITRHGCLKDAVSAVQSVGNHRMHIVRREVGEWEEVRDGVNRDGADCYKKCPEESREMCGRGKTCQLVAKAREVVK